MKTRKEQLGLFSIIWIGFTFIAGITFTASFSQIVLVGDGKNPEQGIGLHIIWLFLVEGLIAFMCAWAFAKLVKYHPQANGGGSQYVRTAFGKFWGLLIGFINYSVIPVIGMALIVTMIRANFGPLEDGQNGLWLVGQDAKGQYGKFGEWGNLYLDLIAFALYIFAATIIFFGIKKYKYVGLIIGYMTWGMTLLLMIFGITAGFMNLSVGNNPFDAYKDQKLTMNGFTNAFTTCFFAFCGIETFISTGKNIKNRAKNMPIAIIVIMIAITIFYIVFSTITMFAVGGPFTGNPNSQLFPENNFLRTFGPTLVIICTILMRFNSSLQITLFGGSTLEPLSSQGYISPIFRKENKENVPVAGVLATMGLFVICAIMFLFIPDIIEGATKSPSPLNYGTIASCASILLIAIYGIIIPVVLVQGFKKKIKVQIWEYIAWFITLAFLMVILVWYFKGLADVFANPKDENGKLLVQNLVSSIFQLVYFGGIVIWAVLQYFLYYKKKMKKMDPNSEMGKVISEYENFFRLLTDKEMADIRAEEIKNDQEYLQYKLSLKEEKLKNKSVSK
ncbi:APC family permease [Spiroplasma cantharicola]|uniref:Putative permease n=1 Tax=Spiroplasma cantharicola TaxID=362837 RepID=A0A0M3SJH7_9MOLU|nr:APC family permease [Spiroplasma cantharicola]ALD66754.1 putative permease [Spiroplasma cantharicola]